jgi:EAL domain-containing protein (putative c-di-GMP-specific phosphodiesterase class I)
MMHDFVESIQITLGTYGIEPSKLNLELTEKVKLNDIEDSMVKLKALKAPVPQKFRQDPIW